MALMRALESLPEPGRPRALITDFTFLRPLLYYQKRGGWMPSLSLEELDAFYWLPTREKRDARMEELLCRARQQDRQMLVLDPTDRYLKNLGLENRGSFSPYGPFFEFKPAAGSLRCPL